MDLLGLLADRVAVLPQALVRAAGAVPRPHVRPGRALILVLRPVSHALLLVQVRVWSLTD